MDFKERGIRMLSGLISFKIMNSCFVCNYTLLQISESIGRHHTSTGNITSRIRSKYVCIFHILHFYMIKLIVQIYVQGSFDGRRN